MIKLEHIVLASPEQMKFIIEGMRNRTVQRSRSNDKNGRCSSWYRKIKRGERSC